MQVVPRLGQERPRPALRSDSPASPLLPLAHAVVASRRAASEHRQLVVAFLSLWAITGQYLHGPASPHPSHTPISSLHPVFSGLIGREQTSWPERLPEEPAEPAAAGVQGQGGAAHPLAPGLDLLRHLHLQHLRLPEGKEPEQKHPPAPASGCQRAWGSAGCWVGVVRSPRAGSQHEDSGGATDRQAKRLGAAEPSLGTVPKSELPHFVPGV